MFVGRLYSCFFLHAMDITDIYILSLHDALPICPGDDIQVTEAQVGFIQLAIVELVADDPPGGLFDAVGRIIRDKLDDRSEEHTSELQSRGHLVCRLLLEKKKILFENAYCLYFSI